MSKSNLAVYSDVSIGELNLRHGVYKRLSALGVTRVQEIFTLSDDVLIHYYLVLFEGIARVDRHHAPPHDG